LITRKLRLWPLAAVAAILLLTACAGGTSRAALTGSSWPGITAFDDAVYMAFNSHVYKINPEDGKQIWRFPSEPQQRQSFYAAPAVSEDLIVVADYTGRVYGVDPENGTQQWMFTAPVTGKFVGGAAIGDDYVYIGNVAGVMYAINKKDGTKKWEFPTRRDIWSAPLLDGNTLYFGTLDRHLYAVNAASGKLIWSYPGNDVSPEESPIGPMVGTPLLRDDILYFGDFNNSVQAFNLETRDLKWTHPTPNWVWSSPTFDEASDALYGGDVDGNVFALDPATGDQKWIFPTLGPVVSAPVVGEYDGDPAVFVTSGDSNLYILDLEDGSKLAEIDVTAEFVSRFLFFDTGTSQRPVPLYAAPILIGDTILVASQEGPTPLMAYDIDSLNRIWAFNPTPAQ
jgi:eukaryotic-like serine/threonine-protein kinase